MAKSCETGTSADVPFCESIQRNFFAFGAIFVVVALFASTLAGCGSRGTAQPRTPTIKPIAFSFEVPVGPSKFQIEGYLVRSPEAGKLPAVLVLNGGEGDARRCVDSQGDLAAALGIHIVCISIPGYGRSSGPGRLVGPQAVAAARRALDLMAQRPEIDADRLAVWGVADGAVAAGLLMDYDRRPKSLILQSGAYDMVSLWPEAPLRTKFTMIHQVWPSRRVLRERSVIENLPKRVDCSVLIVHGARDRRIPIRQAIRLEDELKSRGAHVETAYMANGQHDLGSRARGPVRDFLRETLVASNGTATGFDF
ncbi:MAG TPA: prolyl oligopeptidase family serine peptidase [Candidatus Binataceae bacterium]|nr:prolyl oligopeptidase family serine peptidase [Candidatus Binataceae bacterium]